MAKGLVLLAFYQPLLIELFLLSFQGNTNSRWQDRDTCRLFFDELAKEKGFDPLNEGAWYSLSRKEILSKKGAASLRNCHKGK